MRLSNLLLIAVFAAAGHTSTVLAGDTCPSNEVELSKWGEPTDIQGVRIYRTLTDGMALVIDDSLTQVEARCIGRYGVAGHLKRVYDVDGKASVVIRSKEGFVRTVSLPMRSYHLDETGTFTLMLNGEGATQTIDVPSR